MAKDENPGDRRRPLAGRGADYNLKQAGYEVLVATDGQDGLLQAQIKSPDIVVLDLMLPVIDGLEVCRRLRADAATTRHADPDAHRQGRGDRRAGRLLARGRRLRDQAVQREGAAGADQGPPPPPDRPKAPTDEVTTQARASSVDRRRHQAIAEGKPLELTRSEFRLLDTLIRQPGRVFHRTELIDAALGDDTMVMERTIDVHIRALRRKLGEHADLIETVRGVGYRFRDTEPVAELV